MKTKEVIKRARQLAEPFRVTDGDKFRLKDVDPADTLGLKSEDKPRAVKQAMDTGSHSRQLRAMHAYQTRMGKVQDIEVLIGRAGKFAHKSKSSPSTLILFQRELARLRQRLVKQFLASADRLQDFRPQPSPAGQGGRPLSRE